jgi:cell division protease FtsH
LSVSYRKYKSKIAMAMGGRVAEELVFGQDAVTSGASSDIQQVTKIARAMVTQFGFDRDLGYVDYANEQQSYLGNYGGGSSHSAMTQKLIDDKVRELVQEGYETAKRILTEQRNQLENLAQGLLEYETLTGPEIGRVMRGEAIREGNDDADTPPSSGTPSLAAVPKTRGRKRDGDEGLSPEPSV